MTLHFIAKPRKKGYYILARLFEKKIYHKGLFFSMTWDDKIKRTGDPQKDLIIEQYENGFNSLKASGLLTINSALGLFRKSKAVPNSLVDLFDRYIEDKTAFIQPQTLNIYQTIREQLSAFDPLVMSTDVNYAFYNRYVQHLVRQKNTNNTITRKISYIKTVMDHAIKLGLVSNNIYRAQVVLKKSPITRIALSKAQLVALEESDSPVVRAFLFACYTGLRFSDLNITKDQIISIEKDGKTLNCLKVITKKTLSDSLIPLPDKAMQFFDEFKLPPNNVANNILKQEFKRLGFDTPIEVVSTKGSEVVRENMPLYGLISFHSARYTYAQMIGDLSINDIKNNLTHSSTITTNHYLVDDITTRIGKTVALIDKID